MYRKEMNIIREASTKKRERFSDGGTPAYKALNTIEKKKKEEL